MRVQSNIDNLEIKVKNIDEKEFSDGQPLTSTLCSALTRDTNGNNSDDDDEFRDSKSL